MTVTVEVVLEPASLKKEDGDTLTGIIYFDFGDIRFPGGGWNDFPGNLIWWWINELLRVDGAKNANGLFRFMDGPQEIQFKFKTPAVCELQCLNGGKDIKRDVSVATLKRTLVEAADVLASECARRGWDEDAGTARISAGRGRSAWL